MTRAMKAATAIGIVAAIVGILGGAMMEGTSLTAFLNMPAMILVFVRDVRRHHRRVRHGRGQEDPGATTRSRSPAPSTTWRPRSTSSSAFAEKARKDGLLALESDLEEIDDAFTKKGMQLVVDGTDPDLVREILEVEIDAMAAPPQGGRRALQDTPAASPRRSASSAPSWASCTCSRT